MKPDRRVRGRIVAMLGLLLLLAACGYKDKPVAPQYIVPQAINDLRYVYSADGVMLSWSYPAETVSGDEIEEILEFRVFRAVVAVDDYCEGCPLPFGDPIILPGGALPPEGVKTADYEATVLRPGNLYFFMVRSRNGWWVESKDSNVVSFLWYSPPMPPTDFRVEAGDTENTLTWQPVTRHRDESPMGQPVRYQLFRSIGQGPFAELGDPLAETRHVDSGLENDRDYHYRVQAVNTYDKGSVTSGMSETMTARPIDRTPPPLPSNVQALRTDAGVKVFWNYSQASDLAGYRVYRRVAGQGPAVYVGTVDVPYTIFIDEDAPKGKALFYSVSSIDIQNPPNESQKSAEARAID